MKVLLLGGNGFLGPHVVKELAGDFDLRITDCRCRQPTRNYARRCRRYIASPRCGTGDRRHRQLLRAAPRPQDRL